MALPKVVKVRQTFPRPWVEDVEASVREQCEKEPVVSRLRPGMNVAITAGSRGIADIARIIRALVDVLKKKGVEPFVVPAMGSHGGATAEGQVEILESFGITEAFCGAPVCSSMEVVRLGETGAGSPVYIDRLASEADGVVLVGRIKPHTDFRSEVESGLMKMASIGLGKHAEALALHARGVPGIRDHMVEAAQKVLDSGHVLFGLGIVENAYEEAAIIEAMPPEEIPGRERELLSQAARLVPKLPVAEMDILFVDALGKNYSGTGMDTNVIGRFRILGVEKPRSPQAKYLIVSNLSPASHGNALGVGLADFTTRRLFEKIDLAITRENVLTSTFVERAKIPLVLEGDR